MAKKPRPKKSKSVVTTSRTEINKKGAIKAGSTFSGRHWCLWGLLGLSVLCFLITRLKLLAIPLERDEGSFAYIGHWLWRGKDLYTDMLDSKLPGLYTYYGLFTTLFGYNATGVHVGLLVANIASGICFYLFVKEVFNRYVAVITCSLYLWMIMSANVLGFAAHATQILTPFVLAGILLFWRGLQTNKLYLFFLSGLLVGIAFTIKQQSAILGVLMALIWWPARIWWDKKENATIPILEWLALGVGGLLPAAGVYFYFLQSGRFAEFYDWTVTQPLSLAASFPQPWYKMFLAIIPAVLDRFEGVWIAAGLGLILIFYSGFKKFGAVFGSAFAMVSFLSVVIGAAYYKHYFAIAIPGVALMAACTIYWISQKVGKTGPLLGIGITVFLILLSIQGRADYYFNPSYSKIHYEAYSRNLFPEIERIGKELKRRVPEGSRIGVMGSEPELLVAADRESCTKYLMIYAILFDPVRSPPMQQEYIRDLQACAPDYIVWNTVSGSWTTGYDKLAFFEQLMQWIEQHYETVAIAESRGDAPGVVVWDKELDSYKSENDYKVIVLRKKQIQGPPQG